MPPDYVAVKKSNSYEDDWSSVDDMYEDERQQWLKDNPEPPDPPGVTGKDSRQAILPESDPTLDRTTGWAGVEPVTAIRYMGDHRAGSPVRQGDYQTSFEGTRDKESNQPDMDFDAPTVEAPHGEAAPPGWKDRPPTDKDADHGYPDKGGWLYRDPETGSHYWYKGGKYGFQKKFMDVQEGTQGSWWSGPTEQDFNRAQGAAFDPKKVVALRGDPNKYGIAHQRDSDEALEHLAEMFLEHKKNIPPEALVEFPIQRDENYLDTARRMGIPRGKHPIFHGPNRWSDRRLPFGPPRTGKKVEDMTDTELYRAEPMDIAFQLLKMSADEADELEEQMLSDMERGTSNPRSRRKQRSMGERESKASIHNFPGSSSRREMWDEKQKERDWERWGKRHAEDRAVVGADLPSYHGFGSDMDREIHPGDRGNDFSSMRGPKSGETGRFSFEGTGRENRPLPFEQGDDLMEWLQPGYNESNNLRLFRDKDDSKHEWQPKPWTTSGPINYIPQTEEWVNNPFDEEPTFHGIPFNEDTGFKTGEPMDIAFQLLKDRKSPEAWANKKRYDTQYEKNPKRVKYREQLNTERRRRGIYGKGGADVSHTQGGKLTLENPSSNRARHFKGKGTLRRVKVR